MNTPIQQVGFINNNSLWVKREDLIPYSFGGNKARKAFLFFDEFDKGDYDCVVTYGTSHSNHCRVVANMAAQRHVTCYIISPEEVMDLTFNHIMTSEFGSHYITVPVAQVHDTIEKLLADLKKKGLRPYFIQGGGHGNIGTEAYVNCYNEILDFELNNDIHFDYIFLASGTGTTQAGLISGKLIHHDEREIVGISIARQNPRGRGIILESVKDYLGSKQISISEKDIEINTIFIDDYISGGYGISDSVLLDFIKQVFIETGIPLDSTYTGKAYFGMSNYLYSNSIDDKKVLFLHTGGTPLFFDDIMKMYKDF